MRFEIPDDKKLVHQMVMPIRWGDMDAMGHVNNAVYFSYMESARVGWLESLQANSGTGSSGQGPVVVNAFCNFERQLAYPGDLRIRLYVGEVGRSSFETWVTIERQDEAGVPCARGGATTVWIDTAAGKSTALPSWLRKALAA